MLQINADRLSEAGLTNWRTQVADHRSLPLEDNSADLIVSGWSICYLCSTNDPDWEPNIRKVLAEAGRVLRDGGTMIIMETLGTGYETPCPPDFLKSYYEALVNEHGFSHRWIRTDYQFEHVRQAEELTRFFFGDELADHVAQQQLTFCRNAQVSGGFSCNMSCPSQINVHALSGCMDQSNALLQSVLHTL